MDNEEDESEVEFFDDEEENGNEDEEETDESDEGKILLNIIALIFSLELCYAMQTLLPLPFC